MSVNSELRLISGPAAEPVTLLQFKEFLRIPGTDTTRDDILQMFLVAAREDCEDYCRIKLITQTWLLRSDSFPGVSSRYDRNGFPQIALPFPPFQSIDSFQYVDPTGAVQSLSRDTSNGSAEVGFYGYQLTPGGNVSPALLTAVWARPWPPQRLVPAATIIQFRCGFGGPFTASIAQGGTQLNSNGFVFNPDDAPGITGDTGLPISIPGAGQNGGALNTFVASVDQNGVATLATAATATVTNVTAWQGVPVPDKLQLSILLQAQFYNEQGAIVDMAQPRGIESLRNHFRNLVS